MSCKASAASSAVVSVGKGAGLVVSLTGASLVPMMDNFTPGPFTEELVTAGVPAHLHDWLGRLGIGAL
ncbi:MAG: thioesterase, partial [Actinomycetota bacterium]|nr:thioesterase [Actinomycetota bacterium]